MSRYAVGERAIADMDDLWSYIARDNPDAADRQIHRLLDRIEQLARQPDFGESVGYLTAGLRRSRVGKYVIYYEIETDHVRIRRVIHAARDVRKFFGGDDS